MGQRDRCLSAGIPPPPGPPCNPGRQGASRTVRDGDASGGGGGNSPRDDEDTRVGEDGPRVCGMGTHEVWQFPTTQGRDTTEIRIVDQDVPPMRVTSPPSVCRMCSVWGGGVPQGR